MMRRYGSVVLFVNILITSDLLPPMNGVGFQCSCSLSSGLLPEPHWICATDTKLARLPALGRL